MKKRVLGLIMAAVMAGALAGCGSGSSGTSQSTTTSTTASSGSSETTTASSDSGTSDSTASGDLVPMTLSFSTWVGSGPFYIARDKGFYAEHGLDVNIQIIEDEASYASLMGSESIDALGHVIDRELINYSKGIQEQVVMAYDQSTGGDGIVATEDIQSPEDLKGKTVALNMSSTSYFFFLTVLEQAGLTEDDVTIKDMDADSAGTAFVQGNVDAAVTWEPWLTNANQRDGGHLLVSSADYPNTIVDTVAFTDSFINEHPDEVAGFVAAWNEAVAWYYDGNQDEGNQIMADGLSIDLDDFLSQVKGVTWYDQDSMNSFFDESTDNNIYDVADRAIGFWVDRSLIDSSYDSHDLITSDYLEK